MTLALQLSEHIERKWLVDTLGALVRIPSVTGDEDVAQEYMAKLLKELGGEVDAWRPDVSALQGLPGYPGARVSTSRLDVVAEFAGTGEGPALILNGHIDTVSPGEEARWTYPPFSGTLMGDRLYGRGAADMKGGLVAAVGAVRALHKARLRLKGSIQVQSVHGEEDGGLGAFAALERGYKGDAVIVCEPTALSIVPAHAGVTIFRITVPGRAAHGCVREEGVSAFERFLPIHTALKALEDERNRTLRHPLYDDMRLPWPLSIGMVHAGIWPAIVPERLVCEGRIGVAIGEPLGEARRQLEDAVMRVAHADAWLREHPPTVEWVGGAWQGTATDASHPLVQGLARVVAEVTGKRPAVHGAPYGSDLRLFTNDFGIPGVLFGPGDIRLAHFTDEYVSIAEVEAATLALAVTAAEYCGVH